MKNNKHPHILLVDDDDLNRRMMALLLSDQGYSYETASNGAEAVAAVQSQQFDLVLMDLQMPILDGFEAARKIRAWENDDQHIPIIALTAMLFDDEVKLCLAAGMDDCMSKPFDTKHLTDVVEAYVDLATALKMNHSEKTTLDTNVSLLDVESALPRFDGDIERYREFLDEFIELLPEKVNGFRTAFHSNDFEMLSKQAHNLKGISASLGAMQISRLSLRLDQYCQHDDTKSIQGLLTEFESNVAMFKAEALKQLSSFIKGNVDTSESL